jgi:hypothetical protein
MSEQSEANARSPEIWIESLLVLLPAPFRKLSLAGV